MGLPHADDEGLLHTGEFLILLLLHLLDAVMAFNPNPVPGGVFFLQLPSQRVGQGIGFIINGFGKRLYACRLVRTRIRSWLFR